MNIRSMAMLTAAVFWCGGLRSQAQTPATVPDITGVAHIAFRVSDLDREVNFFGKLGFEEAFTNVENGHVLQVFIKINDMQFIEVYPQTDPPQPLGWMYACYESADLKALNAHYAAEGLKPAPVETAADGDLVFTVQSPQGRLLEFTQYMPDGRPMRDRGQHLGDRRASDELLGFELPVLDMAAAPKFYETLGFDGEKDGANVRLTVPANPDLRIELHSQRVNDQPQFLFPIDDAHKVADELHAAGLKVQREKKLVFVRDPDGNAFVLLETGTHSPRHLIPWRH